jgi:hypothetical protein
MVDLAVIDLPRPSGLRGPVQETRVRAHRAVPAIHLSLKTDDTNPDSKEA